ncbi:MAG TPA: DegV family protein, partial [Gammaproteobacteria bacterium]|nr:DegV family protein [Gammaproteobacteria bacterium]
MPKIQIIADSTCDIPQELIEQYGIRVVPNDVIWGAEEYLDRVTLKAEDFYSRLVTDPVKPTSAQATVQDFSKFFVKAVADGAEEIIVLTV